MKRLIHLFLYITALALCSHAGAADSDGAPPERFHSIILPTGQVTSVFAITQDPIGFIWMGTDSGLLRYDGYDFKIYRWKRDESTSLVNDIVNALAYDKVRNKLYAGTDKGISEYDPLYDKFKTIEGSEGRHVKSIYVEGDSLYAATTTGLFLFHEDTCEKLLDGHFTVIRKAGAHIWAGSYESIYEQRKGQWIRHDLADILKAGNILVLDICCDPSHPQILWIGAENGLFHYDPLTHYCDRHLMEGIPVKTFHMYDKDLWIGTDNGVATLTGGENLSFFRHDVSEHSSIPNNVIWAIAADRTGKLWLGTDHGTATCDPAQTFRFIGVDKITGLNAGLDIGLLDVGSHDRLYIAGRDGLICSNFSLDRGFFLTADSKEGRGKLSHNKVRDLYDDTHGLWIASDGGLDYYDYTSDKVKACHVVEPSGRYKSNWMYAITEDPYHRLWLGTYDGGLFCVDKKKLIRGGSDILCDRHLNADSSVPALRSNIVRDLKCRGSLLYVIYGNSIDIIELKDKESEETIRSVSMPEDAFIMTVKEDDDCLWIGTDRFLYRLSPEGKLDRIPGMETYMMSLDLYDGKVWVAGKSTLASYDTATGEWSHFPSAGLPLMSICHIKDRVLIGTIDGLLELSDTEAPLKETERTDIKITELRVNDETIKVGQKYDGVTVLTQNSASTAQINLPNGRNSFSISLSAFDFGGSDKSMSYRLEGFDDNWHKLGDKENKATFINVPSGNYRFEYALGDVLDAASHPSVNISIAQAWYQSWWARLLYFILATLILLSIYYALSTRHRLKMEHIERQRAISMADSKTEFLSNIAHDFKSPLSIILGFISQLAAHESDSLKTRELQTVQKNAEKMNQLLHSMAEFNADGSSMLFVPTPVDIVAFSRDVWMRYSQVFADKGINCRFVADDIDYLFLIDKVQMESALQNLLSNALKFTLRGGDILMSVKVSEQTSDMVYVDIKVEDSGCGIPEDELPKIFNRYYCGPSSKGVNPAGTGIGLNIVKQVVEMHKGKISVNSRPGKGSIFTIRLSTMKSDSFAIKNSVGQEASLYNLSQVWRHERKPRILLVEDNSDIRDFIIASLGGDYSFITAAEGKEALDIPKNEKIDLVVSDIVMPGMDGITMSRTIRGNLDTAFLPIVILTGKGDANTRAATYEYCDAFITKPFDINYLNETIIRFLIKHEHYLESSRKQKMLSLGAEEVESPDDAFLKEMIAIISEHIDDSEFSATTLHEQSHWSEKQIYRKIKQMTGKTVSEFIRDVRMDKAAAYLVQGKLTIKEVMFKVGYTTQSYFTKCFKERFGILPSEYAEHADGSEDRYKSK